MGNIITAMEHFVLEPEQVHEDQLRLYCGLQSWATIGNIIPAMEQFFLVPEQVDEEQDFQHTPEMEMEKSVENCEGERTSNKMLASLQGDGSSSTRGGLDQEVISEISHALEEMTTTWDEPIYAAIGVQPISVPNHLKINPSDIKEIRLIGKGGSAKVFEATWFGCPCAVKRFSTSYSVECISLVERELEFLTTLNHPHIVRLYGLSVDSQRRCSIVMEFMDTSLRAFIKDKVYFTKSETLEIITKMALGMQFLHSKGISHRDLKADNVLIQGSGGSYEVKIVDFGVSLNINSSRTGVASVAGTGFWRAPEILRLKSDKSCKPDLKAADVYSFAMTCYEVLTRKLPFHELRVGSKEDEGNVISGLVRLNFPSYVDDDLRRLIILCWNPDPTLRPNFVEICAELSVMRSTMEGGVWKEKLEKQRKIHMEQWERGLERQRELERQWDLEGSRSRRFRSEDLLTATVRSGRRF